MNILSKSYVKYGLVMTTSVLVCLALMEVTGNNQSFESGTIYQTIFMMLVPVVVIFFALRSRRVTLGGVMTWKQGLAEGFKISLFFGALSPFVFLAYYLLINPEIVDSVRGVYRLAGASDTRVIVIDMIVQLISGVIFGSAISAIISVFLKRNAAPEVK